VGDFSIEPRGPFTLASAARFIAGWPPAGRPGAGGGETALALGFLVDDWSGYAGVSLRQERPDGPVQGTIVEATAVDPERIREQVARIVSLDHDGEGYRALGERDAVPGCAGARLALTRRPRRSTTMLRSSPSPSAGGPTAPGLRSCCEQSISHFPLLK